MTKDGYIMEKNQRTPLVHGSRLCGKSRIYIIKELIGEGGTSLVYRGKDSEGTIVIVKELYPWFGQKIKRDDKNALLIPEQVKDVFQKLLEREKEVYALSKILLSEGRIMNDPHSWTYVDSFECNNTYYQICQDIEGKALDNAIKEKIVPLKELTDYIDVGLQIIPAVRTLHERNLIHGDLKPQNIFVVDSKPNTFYRCIDFGSAVHEGDKYIISTTPDYAPPEIRLDQNGNLCDGNIGKRGVQYDYDTYAILAIVYKLLTGISPRSRNDKNADMFSKVLSDLFNISDEALDYMNIVFRNGLSSRRELRYKSLDSLEKALNKLKLMLEKKVYIESISPRNISPQVSLQNKYEELFTFAINEDRSVSFFKVDEKRDVFLAYAQFCSYCMRRRMNLKIVPITYRNQSLKETLYALPFGFNGIMPHEEIKLLELKNLGEEYCVIVLGYEYSEKDKDIFNSLQDNRGARFWFFGTTKFDGRYHKIPGNEEDYAISINREGALKYFEVADNYGLSKEILEKLDDVNSEEIEGLCQNGTLWRFGNKIYSSPEVFQFIRGDKEDVSERKKELTLKVLKAIISAAEDEGYRGLNQYQSLSVSDFQLCIFLLKQLTCDKEMSELLSKIYSCCDKEKFREYLLEGYKEIFEKFLSADNAYILGSNYVEFCELVERSGDRKEELRKYKYILHEISKHPELMLKSSMEAKKYEKVIEVATMLIEWFSYSGNDYKNSIDVYYEMRAKAYFEKGDYAKAESDYTELIEKREKKTFEIYINRAKVYVHIKEYDRAEKDYTLAIGINPKNGRGWNLRGILFHDEIGNYERAKVDFKEATINEPNCEVYFTNLAAAQRLSGDWDAAEDSLDEAIKINNEYANAWYEKGKLSYCYGDYTSAEIFYSKAIEMNSTYAYAYKGIVEVQIELKKWKKAYENLLNALKCKYDYNEALNILLSNYEKFKENGFEWEELEKICVEAIAEDPNDLTAREKLLDLYENHMHDERKALAECNQIIEMQPNSHKFIIRRAGLNKIYFHDKEAAISDYKKALLLDNQNSKYWYEWASFNMREHNYDEAETSIDRAIELDPKNHKAWWKRVQLFMEMDKLYELLDVCEKAISFTDSEYLKDYNHFIKEMGKYFEVKDFEVKREINYYSRYAKILMETENWKEAIEAYKEAIHIEEEVFTKAKLYKDLASVQMKYEKWDEAEDSINKAIEMNPNSAEAWNIKGNIEFEQNNYKAAEICFYKSLYFDENNINTLYEIAKMQAFQDDWINSIKNVNKILDTDNKCLNALILEGNIYYLKKDYATALEVWKTALYVSENNPDKAACLIKISRAQRNLKQWEDALVAINKAINISNKSSEAWLEKATIYYEKGEFDLSEVCGKRALELDDNDSKILVSLGFAQWKLNKTNEAEVYADRAIEIDNSHDAWGLKGHLYSSKGEHQKSGECHAKALELKCCKEHYLNLAMQQKILGSYQEAVENIEKAIEMNPNSAEAWNIKGNIEFEQNNYKAAEIFYKKAVELDRMNPAYYGNIAYSQFKQKKWKECEDSINFSIKLNTRRMFDWETFVRLWAARTDKTNVEKYRFTEYGLVKILVFEPSNIRYRTELGRVQLRLHKFDESETSFNYVLKLNPGYAPAWNGLGQLYEDQGDLKNALKCYERAEQLDPTDESYKEDVLIIKEELNQL